MSRIAPEVWTRLTSARPSGDVLTARLAAPDITDRLLAALDSEARRHLLIALQRDEEHLRDGESRGLSVDTRELNLPDHTLAHYLSLTCHDAAGHDAFDLFGGELAAGLAASTLAPAALVTRVLGKWRRFWGQVPRSLLSREEQVGLFAELWFLLRWLLPASGSATATQRWRGPFAARHDFEWSGRSVEAKASTIVRGPVFRIHGLDQLDAPTGGELLFFALRLRKEAGASHSLTSLIAETRTALDADGDALTRFETALAQAGYSPLHEADYAQTLWRIVNERLYSVDATFPKLASTSLASGLPPGVSEIAYTLDLGGYTGPVFTEPLAAAAQLR